MSGKFAQIGRVSNQAWALVLVAGLVLLGGSGWAAAEEISVVVNAQSPVETMSIDEVRSIYMGETTFWGDVHIIPISYHEGSPLLSSFLERVIRTTENVYKTYWIRRIFREGGIPPRKAVNVESALELIARNNGGIGFVYSGSANLGPNVRVVLRIPD
ncbi:MAG: hypothetical protein ACE5FN_05095 [Leptospirillia bacterium]